MKTLAFALILLLLPVSHGFAQMTDTPSSSKVKLTGNTFSYKDSEGYTVVMGEIENSMTFPATNIKIWVGFYDSAKKSPLQTAYGTTLLDVVQPHGKSPFMVKSNTPDSSISQVDVNILGFNSASPKQQLLELDPSTLYIADTMKLSGTITNKGQVNATGVNIHLISYDAFSPPRIVGIQTVSLDDLKPNTSYSFDFDSDVDPRATSYRVLAESDNYQSKPTDVTDVSVDVMTRLITINDISVTDSSGERVSKVKAGTPVDISSVLSIQQIKGGSQPYVYYTQVKQFGEKGTVEFLGVADGIFNSTQMQTSTVSWTPENEGGYFVEVYVWDPAGGALAAPSSTVSIILVTP